MDRQCSTSYTLTSRPHKPAFGRAGLSFIRIVCIYASISFFISVWIYGAPQSKCLLLWTYILSSWNHCHFM